ncbi:hypothetical protein IV203_037734 [Nitzschia inconspicua]|uniref:Uncharacterized protein n=1 Tax=Nitzschia inconspicua TaxID=303405 RepID=A0A9K3LM13_9STRA|nr:hypothetical protein IV203_037734 [Nitzschia inconspicua]
MYYPFGFNDPFSDSLRAPQRRWAAEEEARRRKIKAAEVARRRAEQEMYYRLRAAQEQEEEERRQQEYLLQLEQERQREERASLIRQRQREEEQRRSYEAARLHQERVEAEERRRTQQRSQKNFRTFEDDFDEDNETEFQVVRGHDGRLYQVRNPAFQQRINRLQQREEETQPEFQLVRGPDGRVYRVNKHNKKKQTQPLSLDATIGQKENFSSKAREIPIVQSSKMDIDPEIDNITTKATNTKKDKKSKNGKKKKKITVIVEDASDSEYEDEFKSPWRNRRPSPGEWMEPVEHFQ